MIRRAESDSLSPTPDSSKTDALSVSDLDDQLGEAIETYLALVEAGQAPEPELFAATYPRIQADLNAALDGLALVRGLVGQAEGSGSRLETGRRIAGYRIVRELGRGGMGVVYEAVHVGLDRPVALKVLGTHAAPDSNGRRRFLNEARTAAGLHHTHIVPVFDVGQLGGLCYYAMQRIQGSGLDRVVRHLRRDRLTGSGGSTPSNASSFRARLGLAGRFAFTPLSRSLAVPGRKQAMTLADHSMGQLSIGSESATGSWHGRSGSLGQFEGTDLALGIGKSHGSKLPGSSRPERADEGPPFTPPRGSAYYRWVAEIGREAAQALGHAHERGVIHRDIKPSNLLIDDLGKVWVADFGLARRMADPSLTQHDSLLGTPRYMSPEQGRIGPIDGRSDLYSLGATLYELLTLRPPFDGRSAAELLEQIAKQEPASLRSIDSKIPRDLETIVLKLLSKSPNDRYAKASEVVDDLSRFLNMEPVRARRISPVGRAWRFARRHPGMTSVSTVASITVMAVSIVGHVRVLNERDLAVQARSELQKSMRTQLWREASVVRLSNVPNRRATGLGLIRESAGLKPEAPLQAKLRNEALEFLSTRDVEARPELATGKTRAITFGADGSRIATLSVTDEGESVNLWDFALRKKIHEIKLRSEAANEPSPGQGGPPRNGGGPDGRRDGGGPDGRRGGGSGGGGGGGGMRFGGGLIASVGQCVAVIGSDGQSIRLLDTVTGNVLNHLQLPGRRIFWILATPDGRRLVTCDRVANDFVGPPFKPGDFGDRSEVNLWDVEQMAKPLATLASWDMEPGQQQSQPLAAISPDGQTIAVARSRKTTVALWSAEYGESLGEPIDTQSELTAIAIGADNQLATAGGGEVRLWDLVSKTSLPALTPHQSSVRFLRFSPRGSLLAVVGWLSRDVELWDTAAHAVVAVLPTADMVEDVAFSPDGRTLIASGQAVTSSVWTVVEPDVRTRLSGFDANTRSISIAFRPDGLLALGSWKGTIRFLDAGRSVLASLPRPSTDTDESRSRDNLARTDRSVSLGFDDKGRLITLEPDAIRIYPAPPQCRKVEVIPLPKSERGGLMRMGLSNLVSSRDGRIFLINRGGKLLLWRSDNPKVFLPVATLEGPRSNAPGPNGNPRQGNPNFMRSLLLSPTGDRLYMIDNDGVQSLDLTEGAKSVTTWAASQTAAMTLALSPDGKTLAVGERSGRVTLLNTADGKIRQKIESTEGETEGTVSSLAFDATGLQLAIGTLVGHVNLWNLAGKTPTFLTRLPAHRGVVMSIAYDPQGRHLATCSSDKTVDVWDLHKVEDDLGRLGLAW